MLPSLPTGSSCIPGVGGVVVGDEVRGLLLGASVRPEVSGLWEGFVGLGVLLATS